MKNFLWIGVALTTLCGVGCERSAQSNRNGGPPPPATLARIHFGGFTELARTTNGSTLQEVWRLAETEALRNIALDKLAPAIAKALFSTNSASAPVRPLLDDVLASESIFEMVQHSNHPPVWTLAVRVPLERTQAWQTAFASPNSTTFLTSTNSWIVLRHASGVNATNGNAKTPLWQSVSGASPHQTQRAWLEMEADVPRLQKSFPAFVTWPLPKTLVTVLPRGVTLRTEAKLSYEEPRTWSLEPWRLPLHTIRDPLISFTALRGFGSWLKEREWFQKMGLESLPNQLVAWGQADAPSHIQFATPVSNATNELQRLALNWVPTINSNLVNSPLETIQFHANLNLLNLHMLFLRPFLQRAPEPKAEFLNGGFFRVVPSTNEPPSELFAQLERANLVYYDWEITEQRLKQLRETLQQLPPVFTLPSLASDSPLAHRWLNAIQPKLGNCVTEAALTSAREVSLVRSSYIGFNGLELLTLATWIEGSNFPGFDPKIAFKTGPTPRRPSSPTAPGQR